MSLPNLKNFAYGTLGASLTNSATSLTMTTGHGARFPATGNFYAILMSASYGNAAKAFHAGAAEWVLVTAGQGTDAWTVTRGQQSTSGIAFSSGDIVLQGWSTTDLNTLMPNEFTTRGDIIRRGASAPERVGLGAAGTVFSSDGTDPNWVGLGGGEALQSDTTDWEVWSMPGFTATAAKAMTAGRMYAMPFFVSQPTTLSGLSCNVTTLGTSSNIRLGVYLSKSVSNFYPGTLLVDGGALDSSTTGVKTASVSQVLTPNRWHWWAFLCSSTAPSVTGGGGFASNIGTDASMVLANTIFVTQTYGALPSTFPGSPTRGTTSTFPVVALRFSSIT